MDRPRRPLHSPDNYIYPENTGREYWKLFGYIVGSLIVSLILTFGRGWGVKYVWADYIAVLLIVSSAYKMFRLELFVKIHQSYDLVARKWPIWSYAYPFIELGIGADYLLSNGSKTLYLVTILFAGLTIFTKFASARSNSHLQHACLDRFIRLPAASINLVTSSILLVMGLVMFIFY